ncbi:MAG: Carbonic anhydrase [Candidatus Erwinia impunctatus]|nr:Carbonic anhydrase [Culicoides impunctatus]
MKSLLSTALLSLALSTSVSAHSDEHWSYEGKGSPEHWGELNEKFETCAKGQFQSPVNIRDVVDGKLSPLKLDFHTETESIVNNGHTVVVN